MNMIT